jgi:hypothetical protein
MRLRNEHHETCQRTGEHCREGGTAVPERWQHLWEDDDGNLFSLCVRCRRAAEWRRLADTWVGEEGMGASLTQQIILFEEMSRGPRMLEALR